ncbi:unnamed protein product [Mytilus edulis]|uniref:B box-type domain-containing protein n=1 Tax=Mytilus edulis TaxID=6550 RepID=A0A8S3S3E5_MYTED|nr:unnamed protein product [Mytilus edulis]
MESICNPCERRNIVSKLTHWCSDCEDGLCGKCLKDHKAMKLTQHHHVTEMTEISVEKSILLSIPRCERHPDCREDFLCLDHDLICCHTCLQSDHKDCKNVSNVNVLSKGVSKSELFLSNKRTVQEVRESIKGIIKERQSVKEDVTKQQQRIRMEIANTKSKFMEHINNLEKTLLKELSNIEKENKSFIEEEMTELLKTDKEVEEDDNTLQFITDNGSESRLFIFLKKQRRKQDEIMKMLADVPPTSRVKISLEEAGHEITESKAIDLNNTTQAVSVQRNQATSTECVRQFPILEETLQIQLDPKDFVDRDEKYAQLNLRNVCLAVQDDNCVLVVGHVTILQENTTEYMISKYKNNYRLVKYMYNDKGLTFINGCTIYCDQYNQYNEDVHGCHMNIALSCIPKSTQVVALYGRGFALVDTESMERQWCLEIDNEFQAIDTDENFIYIADNGMLCKYNRNGFLIRRIKFIHCSWFTLTLNGNFACHADSFRLLRRDGSEIFSYHPAGLKTVTADKTGNIYLATGDGYKYWIH